MASLVLALPPRAEDALLREIVEAGHTVLARVTGAREVIAAVRAAAADPLHLVISAAPSTLDREVLAVLDERGARAVAMASSEVDRRNAQALGQSRGRGRGRDVVGGGGAAAHRPSTWSGGGRSNRGPA
ncbi:hypothetical protein [Clavibacter zhangzhiyongii]|uniref:hypothetical protein n=1 Tax=Clavibacter zhangzhiyongii TaxID=2768071 RepID=UPI001F26C178|nr:hypothetical protein [Clavibacter zhangzhiyongii]